ncbi:MAG: selenocysteine-specific translation elongation factor [Acidobacteria bacterium]|nr:MAG: selenocysteine-specific translation elongation factor [Acidobacteriota bacterium]
MKSIIIGTAGHIDHGKTALVKALTGVDADRLPEEKARGITIDIGFAHTILGNLEISFIDVPGHERFIKNMLAGVGGIDLVMLVIAADESIMPQTREHFDICRLLGISDGVVVITKKDLVDDETLDLVKDEVRSFVHDSFLETAPVFAVSSKTGDGIDSLKNWISDTLQRKEQRSSGGIFRLPIDRVFSLKGHGTVITGTLLSGKVRKDSYAEILPFRRKVRIRSIHAHDHSVEEAFAGQRTALNLQGIDKEELERGDTLTQADMFDETSLLDVKLTLLPTSKPVPHNALLRFHHLTNDGLARITLLGRDVLFAGDSGFAQLRLQHPVFALRGDRFILRSHSPLITVGGGTVIDHMPRKRVSRNDQEAIQRLAQLETASLQMRLSLAVAEKGIEAADEKYLKAKLALLPEQMIPLISESVLTLHTNPLLLIEKDSSNKLIKQIQDSLAAFHQMNPLLPGMSKEELRTKSFARLPLDTYNAILEQSAKEKVIKIEKELISLFGRSVVLTDHQQSSATKAEKYLTESGLGFPGLGDLAQSLQLSLEEVKKLLYLLIREGKVIKVAEDYFIHNSRWEDLKKKIRERKSVQKTFSVPDFKSIFGVSRKYAIPLLEQLDREGVTRRVGNERIIL